MHSTTGFKTIIGMQECVYRHSPAGKLENMFGENLITPLQQGFYGNSQRGFPVRVHDLTAFLAFEQGIIAGMPISQSTAMTTPLGSVVGINNIQCNSFVKTPGFKQLLERIKRNTHNFFVESFSFCRKSFEVLNSNIGIKPQSHFGDVSNNLSKPVLDKVVLPCLKSFKRLSCFMASFIGKRLQFFPSFKNLFSFNPNIFSKIGLLQNLSFVGKNRNSKTLAVDINAKNIIPFKKLGFPFGKVSNNFSVTSQPISFTNPATIQQKNKSLIIPVLLDWNSYSFSWMQSKLDKKVGFSVESLAVPWNIELDSNGSNKVALFSPQLPNERASHLNIKGGFFLAC